MGSSTDTVQAVPTADWVTRRPPVHQPPTNRGEPSASRTTAAHKIGDIMIGTIVGLLIIGLLAGFLARALVPGRQSMSVLQTILLGVVGSFVGGLLGRILLGRGDSFVQPSSWIGSVIGAVIVLLVYLLIKRRAANPAPTANGSAGTVR